MTTANIIVNADLCDALGHSGERLAEYIRAVRQSCSEEWPGCAVVVHSPHTDDDLQSRPSSVCDERGVILSDTGRIWQLCAGALDIVLHGHDTIPAPPAIDMDTLLADATNSVDYS